MSRYPWRNTSEDIAAEAESQWETPGGAQEKADAAEQAAKDYSDEKLNDHIGTGGAAHAVVVAGGAAGFMTGPDKTKLDGVAAGANNYVHPATHPPSIIAQDTNNRFVTDTEKADWNAKAPSTLATATTDGLMPATDKDKLNKATNAPTASTIVARDASGRAQVAAPSVSGDIARKAETDAVQANLDSHAGDTDVHVTAADHAKLDGVQAGAEVNQNAFSSVNGVAATSKTDTLQLAGGTGITITEDPTNKRVTVTATGSATPGAHATSHVTGGSDVIPNAVTGGASGLMSGSDAQFVRIEGESKSGAQTKADAALVAANEYTDGKADQINSNYIRQPGYAVTTGSATAYIVTLSPVPVSMPDGFGITIVPHVASGVSPTLNVNGLGAVPLKKQDGTAYTTGELKANTPYTFRKVGSDFLADSGSGEVKITGQLKQPVIYAESIAANDPIYITEPLENDTTFSAIPAGVGRSIAWSPDDVYLAVGHNNSPFVTIYKRSGKNFTKLTDPAVLPTGSVLGLKFSPDGTYLAIGMTVSPYISIYKRSGDTFTKLADPAVLPTSASYSVSWSPDGLYLAVTSDSAPTLIVYKRSGDTFTKLADPTVLPASVARSVAFSPDGLYLALGHTPSPYLSIYKRSGDTFTKLADPATLPPGVTQSLAWNGNGNYIVVGSQTTPFISIYKRSGDVFTKLANPSYIPLGSVLSVAYKPGENIVSIGMAFSPFLVTYRQDGDVFTKLSDPPSLPAGTVSGIAYSTNGTFLAIALQAGNNVMAYSQDEKAHKSTNSIVDLQGVFGAGYALESGTSGETKDVILIWR